MPKGVSPCIQAVSRGVKNLGSMKITNAQRQLRHHEGQGSKDERLSTATPETFCILWLLAFRSRIQLCLLFPCQWIYRELCCRRLGVKLPNRDLIQMRKMNAETKQCF